MIGATIESKSPQTSLMKVVYFDKVLFSNCGIKSTKYKLCKTEPGFETNEEPAQGAQSILMANEIRRRCSWWGRDSPPSLALVVNPSSGKGKAEGMVTETLLPVLRDAAGWTVQVIRSSGPSSSKGGMVEGGGGCTTVTEASRLIATGSMSSSSYSQGRVKGGREEISGLHQKVDLVAFIGGDGTVWEGLQGLMAAEASNPTSAQPFSHHRGCPLPFVHVPGGSGNGLAASCGLWDAETAAYAICKGKTRSLDIASCLQPSPLSPSAAAAAVVPKDKTDMPGNVKESKGGGLGGKRFYSFLSTVFGVMSNLDIGTEHLRWMGEARYTHKVIQEAWGLQSYPCRVAYLPASVSVSSSLPADPSLVAARSVSGLVDGFPSGPPLPLLSQIEGLSSATSIDPSRLPPGWLVLPHTDFNFLALYNVPFMATHARMNPAGSLDDGAMDLIWARGLSGGRGRLQFLEMMLKSEEGGHVNNLDFVKSEKVRAFAIEPLCDDSWLVVDGEVVEKQTTWIEVHPSACNVIINEDSNSIF